VRWILALLVLAGRLALPVLAANEVPEQTVTPVAPGVEQRVDGLTPDAEQRVEAVDGQGVQQVMSGTTPEKQGPLATAGKATVGVLAAVLSVGTILVTLLLI
jgi:hypothetical protein